jgi:hypothetical protein
MAISDGQRVRALESNAAWASKQNDNTLAGVQTLANPGSGPTVTNTQQKINDIDVDLLQAQSDITNLQGDVSTLQQDVSDLQAIETFVYLGAWDASTNTPTIADGDGGGGAGPGGVYRVSVAGSQDLGSGTIDFNVADRVVYNSAGVYEKWDVTDEVTSVNGQQGDVVLELDDIDNVNAPLPTAGQVLTWDDVANEWQAKDTQQVFTTKVEYRTITSGEATAKELTLVEEPKVAGEVVLDVIGGGPMFYGDDFSVSGQVLTWDTLALDGIISTGDRVRISYIYE